MKCSYFVHTEHLVSQAHLAAGKSTTCCAKVPPTWRERGRARQRAVSACVNQRRDSGSSTSSPFSGDFTRTSLAQVGSTAAISSHIWPPNWKHRKIGNSELANKKKSESPLPSPCYLCSHTAGNSISIRKVNFPGTKEGGGWGWNSIRTGSQERSIQCNIRPMWNKCFFQQVSKYPERSFTSF